MAHNSNYINSSPQLSVIPKRKGFFLCLVRLNLVRLLFEKPYALRSGPRNGHTGHSSLSQRLPPVVASCSALQQEKKKKSNFVTQSRSSCHLGAKSEHNPVKTCDKWRLGLAGQPRLREGGWQLPRADARPPTTYQKINGPQMFTPD